MKCWSCLIKLHPLCLMALIHHMELMAGDALSTKFICTCGCQGGRRERVPAGAR